MMSNLPKSEPKNVLMQTGKGMDILSKAELISRMFRFGQVVKIKTYLPVRTSRKQVVLKLSLCKHRETARYELEKSTFLSSVTIYFKYS